MSVIIPLDAKKKVKKDIELLTEAIKVWKLIVKNPQKYHRREDCPLCEIYNSWPETKHNCHGCPIYKVTQKRHCQLTPYPTFVEFRRMKVWEKVQEQARKEVKFLKKVRSGEEARLKG